MFKATRYENYVQYFFNGTRFLSSYENGENQAARYETEQDAMDALAKARAHYFDSERGEWIGRPVQVTTV